MIVNNKARYNKQRPYLNRNNEEENDENSCANEINMQNTMQPSSL